MATYKARLSAPSASDKNYLHTSVGGYNSCIQIKNGSCLPNCVGYSWGRWRELLGYAPKLSRGNAENWWGYKDGYERGQTPKLGAVICWRKGKAGNQNDGAGHVAIVERINADGSITCSESNYGGSRFNVRTLKAPYSLGSSYTFQGFIYLPITFETEKPKEVPTTSLKFKVGDKVVVNGNLYKSSNADSPVGVVKNKTTVITRVAIGSKHPYNTTGDLGWMDEASVKAATTAKSVDVLAREVIAGMWGNGADRKARLTAAGYDYNAVQARVNALLR